MRRLTAAVFAASICVAETGFAQTYFDSPVLLSSDSHWTNYLRVVDLTGDGHMDVIVANSGGFFTPPSPQPFQIYLGSPSGLSNQTASVLGSAFDKAVRQFALADVNADGLLDLYVPDAGGSAPDKLFVRQAGGGFVDEAATRLGGIASTAGAARFGDFDGDGDPDLIVLNGYASNAPDFAKLYLNDGAGNFTESSAPLPPIGGGQDPDDVDVADFDRDFDLDLFINLHTGKSLLWLNDGSGQFSDASANIPAFNNGFHYGPAVCDVDGDGDLDIWVDNVAAPYAEMLLINDGSGNFTNETAARVTNNPQNADDNGLACVDVDGDGDLDAVIMSLSNNERVLLNDGTGNFNHVGGFPQASDPTLWFDFGDLNGDGRLDCVTGQGESQPQTNRIYYGSSTVALDTRPPAIIAAEPAAAIVRFAVSDRLVTDDGPELDRAFARVSAPAPVEHPARFIGGDLFRVEIPADAGATVVYRLCAVDRSGNEACGDEQTFVAQGGSGGTGGGGQGGAAGNAGNPGTGGSAGGAAGNAGAAGGAGAPASGGSDSGGCGCRVDRRSTSQGSLLLALLLAGVTRFRRRRDRRR